MIKKKNLNKLDINEMYFNIIKVTYGKAITMIILNGETLKRFPLRAETRPGCYSHHLTPHDTSSPSYSN